MRHKTRIQGLLIYSMLTVTLAGCSGNTSSSNPTDVNPPSTTASDAGSLAPDKNGTAALYIGAPGHVKEVSVPDASTAEQLIAALAKETGWNLTLAQPPAAGELQDTLKIAFAEGSAIYSAPPNPQKDSYHVFAGEDYILTVLDSVSETLCKNLDLTGVYFTSPDGGVLTLENGGYHFCYSNLYCWDYVFAQECNEPLPENEIGDVFTNPNQGPILEGPANLEIVFKRANVKPMAGTITIYDGDGSVLETMATNDSAKVRLEDVSDYDRNYYNLKEGEGTSIHIFPTKDFEAGKKYSVSVSEGAFTAANGLKSKKIERHQWSFYCIDMKITVTPKLGHEPVIKVGKPVTYHFQFSDDVKRVYVQKPKGDADYSYSPKELTSDGDIVFTPNKLGEINWIVRVELKDGNIISFSETPTVTE